MPAEIWVSSMELIRDRLLCWVAASKWLKVCGGEE